MERDPLLDFVNFPEKADRSAYIAEKFGSHLSGRVLDVGCAEMVLKKLRPDLRYTGIDIDGEPDLKLNLEKVDRLPFDDGAFDVTVCTDVLEHLDNLHFIFGELVRVTAKTLIVSLPNNWANARQPIARGRGSFMFYGLPLDPPPDRHKWFFGYTDAVNFFRGIAPRYALETLEMRVCDKPRLLPVRALRRLRHPSRNAYLNRFSHTVWAVYRKPVKSAASGA